MASAAPLALVITASSDRPTYEPVVRRLERAGLRVLVFEADRVVRSEQPFTWSLHEGHVSAELGEHAFRLESVRAAWWRKPQWLEISRTDAAIRLSLEHEIVRLQEDLWDMIPERIWLNAPSRMREATRLPRQLQLAHEIGFQVPETIVSNDWQATESLLACGDVVFKTLGGTLVARNRSRALFTARLDVGGVGSLRQRASPYPGLLQPYLAKRKEWRVTVVDRTVFAAAIYTTAAASEDWRRYQLTPEVRFAREELPADIAERCVQLTLSLGLTFAAIDLIETESNEYYFLEANPNGQYRWIEVELGLGISRAISDVLLERSKG